MTAQEAIAPVLEALKDFELDRLVLFGSSFSSDRLQWGMMELAVVFPEPKEGEPFDRVELINEIRTRLLPIHFSLADDFAVYKKSEFDRLSELPGVKDEIPLAPGATFYERTF